MAADDPSGRGDPGAAGGSPAPATLGFDTSVAHPARIWDYFLGGKDNTMCNARPARACCTPTGSGIEVADYTGAVGRKS